MLTQQGFELIGREALRLKPLLLHASSPVTAPKHRRVLHLVYHSGERISEPWHRAL